MEVSDYLDAVHAQDWPLNDGLSLHELRAFEKKLGIALPPELARLYADHDGVGVHQDNRLFQLMPSEEVLSFYADVEAGMPDHLVRELTKELSPMFWWDFNSTYAGVYLTGPKTGNVFIIDHDADPMFSVRFVTVASFLSALRELLGTNSLWYDMRFDFPDE